MTLKEQVFEDELQRLKAKNRELKSLRDELFDRLSRYKQGVEVEGTAYEHDGYSSACVSFGYLPKGLKNGQRVRVLVMEDGDEGGRMRKRIEIPIIAWDKRIDPCEFDTLILRLKVPSTCPSDVPPTAKLFVEWDVEDNGGSR